MDHVPQELRPTGTFQVRLVSGQEIILPLCQPTFKHCIRRGGRVANATCKVLKFLGRASAEKFGKPVDLLEVSGAAPAPLSRKHSSSRVNYSF
jgi:hypothetical protein